MIAVKVFVLTEPTQRSENLWCCYVYKEHGRAMQAEFFGECQQIVAKMQKDQFVNIANCNISTYKEESYVKVTSKSSVSDNLKTTNVVDCNNILRG